MAEEKVSELLAAMDEVSARYPLDPALSRLEVAVDAFRTPTPVTEDVGEWSEKARNLLARIDKNAGDPHVQLDHHAHALEVLLGEAADLIDVALSASPSPPKADGPGEVSVKPLVWDRITSDQLLAGSEILGGETALAPSIFGDYQVWGDGTWRTPHSLGAKQTAGNGGTLDAGMRAAQADYEARILSALVSPSIKREA